MNRFGLFTHMGIRISVAKNVQLFNYDYRYIIYSFIYKYELKKACRV